MCQKQILVKAYSVWGVDAFSELYQRATMNDRLRVVGILAMDHHRDNLLLLSSNRMQYREKIDDPSKHPSSIYEEVAMDFNNSTVVVAHPVGVDKLQGYLDMDPNDKSRVNIKRDSRFIKSVYIDTM